MATGVNYRSCYQPHVKVSQSVWGGEQESSSEEGGGGVTWETPTMEVKGQLISAPDSLTCPDRKKKEQMAELLERRRSLQALLSSRLAELRRICLQEAELIGEVSSDFPLDVGEKLPCVTRRAAMTRPGNRKCRTEDEDSQRSKLKKTLFSSALRKHNDEHNTHTHTHHGKRTVHRGCHTDDTVKSESSSISESMGHDNDQSQCRPLLVSTGSPVEVYYQSRRRNSLLCRTEPPEPLPPLKLHPLPPPPPPRSQDSSSSGPSDPGAGGGVSGGHRSNNSDGLLDRVLSPEERPANGVVGRGRRGGAYSEVLMDFVWSRQHQVQRQQSQPARHPTTAHPVLYNGQSPPSSLQAPPPPQGAPPTYRGSTHSEQQRVKVTRTKSCGPFLPVSPGRGDALFPPLSAAIQPDPHPYLLPPRPPQLHLNQDAQLEDATRSLHKALALEGLRDWYLRNTLGSAQLNQTSGKVALAKVNGGVKGQSGALQRRRTTHGVLHQPIFQAELGSHQHHKPTLPHSATFHGQPMTGSSLHDTVTTLKQDKQTLDQPSAGTLV
ncbi:coiled-coil domain-containing protein 120 [Gouania willdenowi]|uniref:Coiled-coil domain-containing protein 120-like n=1 Tax=Gouania willdenowi TaxID=441366 RepID=A0A8C5GD63_GOUWI|nr:coiled-coil domain-containing protein 120-like [Gouania willdenowi]XP_028308823.1 coiled-coil domain-containing protein 120-like [Gouania willdenowi]